MKERSKVEPGGGRHELGLRLQAPKVIEGLGLKQIALVKDKDPLYGSRLDLRERLLDGRALLVPVGVVGVNHLEDEVGGSDLGKRGLEALDEVGRELLDEANGIGEGYLAALVKVNRPSRGVERGEELVLRIDARVGEGVEQR